MAISIAALGYNADPFTDLTATQARMPRLSLHSSARQIHAWGAAVVATVLIVVSLTGAALVWKREYLWITIPEARGSHELSTEQAALVHTAALELFGESRVLMTSFSHEHLALHKVYLTNRAYAYMSSNGELLEQWQAGERFEELLYDFHHRLLLDKPGLLIVGFSGIVMIALVPLGLIAWWPTRRSFRASLWLSGAWQTRREMRMTHRNLGIVCLLPLLGILLSGVVLVFPQEAQQLLPDGSLTRPSTVVLSGAEQRTHERRSLEFVLQSAKAQFPGASVRSISPLRADDLYGHPRYAIALQRTDEFHPRGWNTVEVDASGVVLKQLDSQSIGRTEQGYKLMWPLHTGRIGSLLYKMVLTIVGLAIGLLAMMGLRSFIRRW